MLSDWLDTRSFEQTNLNVLQNEILCDITFLAGKDKQEVKAHKVILASRSPVFYSMFCGYLAETKDVIEIPDIEGDALKTLLRFLYTEECEILPETAMSLMYGAKKYEMKRLLEKCRQYLVTEISIKNVCLILQHAHQFDEEELIQKCLKFIFINAKAVLKSSGFRALSKDILQKLIESDELVADEVDIYEACKDWASEQLRQKSENEHSPQQIRKELGELLFLIRFPLIDQKVFATRISKEEILTPNEKVFIFQSFHEEASSQNETSTFSTIPRERFEAYKLTVTRFKEAPFQIGWSNSSQKYGICFKVSGPALLVGVSMFSPCLSGSISGSVSLLKNNETLTTTNIEIQFQEGTFFKDVLFDKTTKLDPGTVYTVQQRMSGARSYFGKNGKQICTCECLGIQIEFSNCDKGYFSHTTIEQGQIHGLILLIK